MEAARQILAGDFRAAGRLMRRIDDGDPDAIPVLASLYPHTGRARILGITGSPGVGKSTLIDAVIGRYRSGGMKVGVVAVDPTSPFSGGAILGDRVRMQRHATDPGVFIRSLATRGRLGGLSASAGSVVQILDAMGFGRVLLETVGVGQDEVDVMRYADATVVVVAPGQGDDVQAHKAGLLEIADVLVVNKADLEGCQRTVRDLTAAAEMAPAGARRPKVLCCVASRGDGIPDLVDEVERLFLAQDASPGADVARRERSETLVADLALARLASEVRTLLAEDPSMKELVASVLRHDTDPYSVADAVLSRVKRL
jgi:LAO/AO transport system kinase